MTTVVDSEAVQVHQTDPPLLRGLPGNELLVSAFSRVAPASVPAKVTDEPVRGVRLAKSSFAGVWPSAPATDNSMAAAKEAICRVLIFLAGGWSAQVWSSNLSARKREQPGSTNGEGG